MAQPSNKQGLIDYSLRRLGFPVIDINIDEDQLDDRVDDALQKYSEFHYDGTSHEYLAIRMSAEMLANAQNSAANTVGTGNTYDTTTGTSHSYGTGLYGYIPMPDSIVGVKRVFPLSSNQVSSSGSNFNIFDLNYQLRLNELYEFTSSSYQYYWIARTHIQMLQMILVGQNPIRFNRKMNRLYIDMNWRANEIPQDRFFIVECQKVLDPSEFPLVFNDSWLKEYTTQLIKKQWGENLKKYGNYTLPGGMVINGQGIYNEAMADIIRLETQLRADYEEPPTFEVG